MLILLARSSGLTDLARALHRQPYSCIKNKRKKKTKKKKKKQRKKIHSSNELPLIYCKRYDRWERHVASWWTHERGLGYTRHVFVCPERVKKRGANNKMIEKNIKLLISSIVRARYRIGSALVPWCKRNPWNRNWNIWRFGYETKIWIDIRRGIEGQEL